MALNYDAITALTRKKHIPKLIDNFFNSHPLLVMLRDRQKPASGVKIVEPLIYGELANVQSYKGFDTITYDQTIPITAAEYSWKHLVAPIVFAKTDEIENAGEEQVLSALEAKVRIAEESLKKQFSVQIYGDGAGNAGKNIDGLGIAVANTGTYGGIDRATYAWWQAKVYANGGAARPLTTRLMRQVYLAVSDGQDKPGIIVTTKALWNRYAEIIEGTIQVQTDAGKKLASLGFQVLEFMGTPVVWDNECPAGAMYFLNTDYLQLRYSPQANFTPTRWRQSDSMVAAKQEILWSGNLTSSNCRRQAKLVDLDETGY